ncbi:MAG: hypothetical protein ABIG96_06480 [Candidatus Micrarchaeota archaeon]
MRKIILLFAETALELVPQELIGNGIIRQEAKKRHLKPDNILLDSNKHDMLMRSLPMHGKRGRPDIIHFSLLTALESIANKENLIWKVYVHTCDNNLLEILPETRLPRVYNRFVGIMEQVLFGGSSQFIKMERGVAFGKALEKAIGSHQPKIYFFNEKGKGLNLADFSSDLRKALSSKGNSPILLVFGCFPHGMIADENRSALLKSGATEIRFGNRQLTVWTLVGTAINLYELEAGL